MKTQRRHELQTNELADWLGGKIEAIGDHSRTILATIVAIAVVVGLYYYYSHRSVARQEEIWDQYFAALDSGGGNNADTEPLRDIVQQYPDKLVGDWARLNLADRQLNLGIEQMFTDRTAGRAELQEAITHYQKVVEGNRKAALVEMAMLGLGKAQESLNNLEEARTQYRNLLQKWPEGVCAGEAKRRLDDLDRKTTKDFYDWFAKREPKAGFSDEPGTPGLKPDFNPNSLPFDEKPFKSSFDSTSPTDPKGKIDSTGGQPPSSNSPASPFPPPATGTTDPLSKPDKTKPDEAKPGKPESDGQPKSDGEPKSGGQPESSGEPKSDGQPKPVGPKAEGAAPREAEPTTPANSKPGGTP